jgi:signal transduction histidine kinase
LKAHGARAEARAHGEGEARMLDLARLRVYRILLYLAVSVLIAGTVTLEAVNRLETVAAYLGLGILGIALQQIPRTSRQLPWQVSLGFDLIAHTFVVFRMDATGGPFLLLFAVPVLVWGVLRGLPGGVLAATGTIVAYAFHFGPWNGAITPARAIQILSLDAVAFLLLGAFSALLGRRIQQEEEVHRQTRLELEQTQLDAASIVTCLSSGLLCLDAEGALRLTNTRASQVLGIAPLSAGTELSELGRLSGLEPLERALRIALAEGREASIDLALLRPGRRLDLEVKTSPILGTSGQIRGLVVLLSDVSDRIARELEQKRKERLALIGQLSAGLAHEIRNSLKPITGCVELLRNELAKPSESVGSLMEIILREAENLESFLTEFLSFARDKTLQVESLALERVVEEERVSLAALSGRPVRVVPPAEGETEGFVLSDRGALAQILRNLGMNAIEASDPSTEIEIGWTLSTEEAVLFLRDRGPGIPEEIRERVYDPFFTTKTRGTGLGLAIARDLADRLGGGLALEPAAGGGTLATLRLRRAESDMLAEGASAA